MIRKAFACVLAGLVAGASLPAVAQTDAGETNAGPERGLTLELNRAVSTENGCRVGFVIQNKLDTALSKAAFEVVLFNQDDMIEQLLVMDFGALPEGKTKVREFNLSNTDCADLGRVLVNGASACDGADGALDAGTCMNALAASSRADGIEFGL